MDRKWTHPPLLENHRKNFRSVLDGFPVDGTCTERILCLPAFKFVDLKLSHANFQFLATLGALYFTPVSRSLGQTVVAPNKTKQTNKNEKQISRNKQTKTRNE